MDTTTAPTTVHTKYQKLNSDYTKLRSQAQLLKNAMQEEQNKNLQLQEQLHQHEINQRRTDQAIESLEFRNKQLEHRVTVLQDEIAQYEGRKLAKDKGQKKKSKEKQAVAGATGGDSSQDVALMLEDLQNKIIENAQLTTVLNEKERELALHVEHIGSLEKSLRRLTTECGELERHLRHEIEQLQQKNSELETKLIDATSMLGSEDAVSASGSDNTNLTHLLQNHTSSATNAVHSQQQQSDENQQRLADLEKEVVHWRTQYELAVVQRSSRPVEEEPAALPSSDLACSTSSMAANLLVEASCAESKSSKRDSLKDSIPLPPLTKEHLICNKFNKQFEDLLRAKCMATSQLRSYEAEVEHLQHCLEHAVHEAKAKDEQMRGLQQNLRAVEEDLATTRSNYEEQISVLTEQVISLSEQLAACK